MYPQGQGVPKDYSKAKEWFVKAVKLRGKAAHANLSEAQRLIDEGGEATKATEKKSNASKRKFWKGKSLCSSPFSFMLVTKMIIQVYLPPYCTLSNPFYLCGRYSKRLGVALPIHSHPHPLNLPCKAYWLN